MNPVGRCMAAKLIPGRRGMLLCVLPVGHDGNHADESDMFGWADFADVAA